MLLHCRVAAVIDDALRLRRLDAITVITPLRRQAKMRMPSLPPCDATYATLRPEMNASHCYDIILISYDVFVARAACCWHVAYAALRYATAMLILPPIDVFICASC